MTIAIIGGGIAGLSAAIAIAQKGHRVDLYEQADGFHEVGAGLQTGPNAHAALSAIGLAAEMEKQATTPQAIHILDGLSGRRLSRIELGQRFNTRFGQPYRVIHRAGLINLLQKKAAANSNISLFTNRRLTGLDQLPDAVRLEFADGQESRHDFAVAADGVHSVCRKHVFNSPPPVYAGHTLYRALCPADDLRHLPDLSDVQLWLYPRGHVVHYPVSGGRKMNIVAAFEQRWTGTGWSTPASPDEVTRLFHKAAKPLCRTLDTPGNWLKWAAAFRPPASNWIKRNIAFIGDAIHPTLPYLAQGAAMALEDSVALAHALDRNLEQWERSRRERTGNLVSAAARLGRIYHLQGPLRHARNLTLSATSTSRFYKQLEWIYNWSASI